MADQVVSFNNNFSAASLNRSSLFFFTRPFIVTVMAPPPFKASGEGHQPLALCVRACGQCVNARAESQEQERLCKMPRAPGAK